MKILNFVQTFTCVKSLVTLALTGTFVFLCCNGTISAENFMTIYTMIIGFYFGTQWQKKAEIKPETKEENND